MRLLGGAEEYCYDTEELDALLLLLVALPAAQQVPAQTAELLLLRSLQVGTLSFHKQLPPVVQLDVQAVFRVMYEAIDSYR